MEKQFEELFSDFRLYKSSIPVFGCIMLNPKMSKFVLVCDWNSKSWMFPRGKVNEGESDIACAVREVAEETGFNAENHLKEDDHLVVLHDGKKIKLYIATNVPENTVFSTKTRKEISKIEFFPIDSIPKSTYCVYPFIQKLKRWISKQPKRKDGKSASNLTKSPVLTAISTTMAGSSSSKKMSTAAIGITAHTVKNANSSPKVSSSNPLLLSPGIPRVKNDFDTRNADTFDVTDSAKGWGVSAMFKANSRLTGKNYQYDGSPQSFGASHPVYINYNSASSASSTGGNKAKSSLPTMSSSLNAFEELSAMSMIGHRLLRGENAPNPHYGSRGIAAEGDDIDDQFSMLPPSNTSLDQGMPGGGSSKRNERGTYFWTSKRFSVPFALDVRSIMADVDAVLRSTQKSLVV
jgi:ADP-ribose pyrophosphatase YjhB (NUDIX family)